MSFKNKILLVGNSAQEVNLSPKLMQEGFIVDAVENNFEAKSYLNRSDSHLQLILSNLNEDNETNITLLQKAQIFEKKKSCKVPIIFFSKKAKLENLFALSHYGYCDYINQPFEFNELMLKIKTNSFLNAKKLVSHFQQNEILIDNYYKLLDNINPKLATLSSRLDSIEKQNVNQSENIKLLIKKIRNILNEISISSLRKKIKNSNKIDLIEYIKHKLKVINFRFYEYKNDRNSIEILMNDKYFLNAIDEILYLFINYTNHNNPMRFYEIINDEFYILKIVSFGFNIYKVKAELEYANKIFAFQKCKLTTNFSKEGMQLLIFIPINKIVET